MKQLSLGNTDIVVLDQIKRFYPKRLEDYQNGKLLVLIHVLGYSAGDIEWFDELKEKASITDPTCTLIMGFDQAFLFLIQPMMDPLTRHEKGEE